MKLGEVLAHQRQRAGLTTSQAASCMQISDDEYQELESGTSDAEEWAPILAMAAVTLGTPTSRLFSESGKARDATPGRAAHLLMQHRNKLAMSVHEMAETLDVSPEKLVALEESGSRMEQLGIRLLRFAETIEQPVFNLLHPRGLPLADAVDY
jgi:DNA-binding XRE family transcriptional regulator